MAHLNVNSIRNKFESMNELIKDNFDIFLITESKLDPSFPNSQFYIPGYRLFTKDRNKNGGGVIFYINQDLPVKLVTNKFPENLEILPLEITVLGKFPPGQFPPRTIPPGQFPPGQFPPWTIPTHIFIRFFAEGHKLISFWLMLSSALGDPFKKELEKVKRTYKNMGGNCPGGN